MVEGCRHEAADGKGRLVGDAGKRPQKQLPVVQLRRPPASNEKPGKGLGQFFKVLVSERWCPTVEAEVLLMLWMLILERALTDKGETSSANEVKV